MQGWMRLAIAVGGALSIYLGYRLFCDIPFRQARTLRTVFLVNLIAGAALAILGVGMLIADVRAIQSEAYKTPETPDSRAARVKRPAREGSFTIPKGHRYKNVPGGLV